MKVYEVAGMVKEAGEYILGFQVTGSHACYLIYGVLKPGERGREFKPGVGHEEMVLALDGDLALSGQFTGILKKGQTVHLRGEETCTAGNLSDKEVRYVIAGGHSEQPHH